jgi:hypothetical protein
LAPPATLGGGDEASIARFEYDALPVRVVFGLGGARSEFPLTGALWAVNNCVRRASRRAHRTGGVAVHPSGTIFVTVAGWALKGAVAYAGTKAIGEAAVRYFEARS